MNFKMYDAKEGDVLKVSDAMSLRFERFADDLQPVWQEMPVSESTVDLEDGHFIKVTNDCWFVHDHGHWRMMSHEEHIEATRQGWLKSKNLDKHIDDRFNST